MPSLEESWQLTTMYLEASRALLPEEMFFEEAKIFDRDYSEYLVHNDLELAMNALDNLGILCNAPDEF